MPKYRAYLPEQERIIEADDEDEAQEIFMQREDTFDFLEVQPAEDGALSEQELEAGHDPGNCSICEGVPKDDIPY